MKTSDFLLTFPCHCNCVRKCDFGAKHDARKHTRTIYLYIHIICDKAVYLFISRYNCTCSAITPKQMLRQIFTFQRAWSFLCYEVLSHNNKTKTHLYLCLQMSLCTSIYFHLLVSCANCICGYFREACISGAFVCKWISLSLQI